MEAVLRSVQPAALPVETLGPDLQKGAAAPPSSLQVILFRAIFGFFLVEEQENRAAGRGAELKGRLQW